MRHLPGQVYRRIDRPDALVVVLSSERSNRRTGWVTVCMYSLTGLVGNLADSKQFHSLAPAPGYVTWTIHQSVPAAELVDPVGEVETAAITASRFAMEARFGVLAHYANRCRHGRPGRASRGGFAS